MGIDVGPGQQSTTRPVKIAVVIPAYKVEKHLTQLLHQIGPEVSAIIIVDDACPSHSGINASGEVKDDRIHVVRHETNLGVGGAVKSGYKKALELGMDVVVKIDGDGQMDPSLILNLVAPILHGEAEYSKGNRFFDVGSLSSMPKLRIFGNLVLSFYSKLSSGYWSIFDPNNGFTAIRASKLRLLPLEKISNRYFFESDMLFQLGLLSSIVADVPMDSKYGTEKSNLRITRVLFEFPYKHSRNATKRIFYNYFLRDFSIASIELLLGMGLTLFGAIYGLSNYLHYRSIGEFTPTGTQIVVAMSVLSGLQFLLGFLAIDMRRNRSI
jgi:dolichol-phosphate mannosyltransferase